MCLIRMCLVAALPIVLAGGCAVDTTTVKPDYDRKVNFAGYQTFSFATGKIVEKPGYEKIDRQKLEDRIRSATRAELETRGMTYVTDSPDLVVTYTAGAQKKVDVITATPAGSPAGIGPRAWDQPGAWKPAGWEGGVDDQFWQQEYTQGTLILEMYDPDTQKLVWKSYCVVEIMSDAHEKNRAPGVIKKALKAFPPK